MGMMLDMGPGWIEQYISALVLLNVLLGNPTYTEAIHPTTPDSLILTLNAIAHGRYQPNQFFSIGRPRVSFHLISEEVVATKTYTVIVLNARTAESDFVSVDTGGVIFEDPAWAVFAAQCIAKKQMLAVPKAVSNKELLTKLSDLEKAVQHANYVPSNFFAPITGFINSTDPQFTLLQIDGRQLAALRSEGIQSFGKDKPRFYVLFQPPH
jgi:hypothetical protein